jgi:hypothetical protein
MTTVAHLLRATRLIGGMIRVIIGMRLNPLMKLISLLQGVRIQWSISLR